MKFVSIRELRSRMAAIRKDLEQEREIVLTANGRPFLDTNRHSPKKAIGRVSVVSPAGGLPLLHRSA